MMIGVISMGGIALVLGAILAIATSKLSVEEDPRIEEVADLLPGANCAACGLAGCRNFAEKLVAGEIDISLCNVLSEKNAQQIAKLMGMEFSGKVTKVARVFCGGGKGEAKERAQYYGIPDCNAANLANGGPKACVYGCFGFGNCARSCPFDAMFMDDNGIPYVIDDKCTACGKCVAACPRDLIELVDTRNKNIIQCRSQDKGAVTRKRCSVGCIACGLCVKNCPVTAIEMQGNLAVMNFETCENYGECVKVCPTKTIVNIDEYKETRSFCDAEIPAGLGASEIAAGCGEHLV